jgi:hypothetical protein
MACPTKKWWQSWNRYCSSHPGCPGCVSAYGSYDIGSDRVNGLYMRLDADGQWEELTDDEIAVVKALRAELEASLPTDPLQRNLALADFYAKQGLPLLRIQALDDALSAAGGEAAARIAMDLADALRGAGFYLAAAQTSDYVPQLLSKVDKSNSMLLGQALQNKARSLDLLGQTTEADAVFATAQHILNMAGQLQR